MFKRPIKPTLILKLFYVCVSSFMLSMDAQAITNSAIPLSEIILTYNLQYEAFTTGKRCSQMLVNSTAGGGYSAQQFSADGKKASLVYATDQLVNYLIRRIKVKGSLMFQLSENKQGNGRLDLYLTNKQEIEGFLQILKDDIKKIVPDSINWRVTKPNLQSIKVKINKVYYIVIHLE